MSNSITIDSDAELLSPKSATRTSDAELLGPKSVTIRSDAYLIPGGTIISPSDGVLVSSVTDSIDTTSDAELVSALTSSIVTTSNAILIFEDSTGGGIPDESDEGLPPAGPVEIPGYTPRTPTKSCDVAITCPGTDFPIENFSSELPDVERVCATAFFTAPVPLGDNPDCGSPYLRDGFAKCCSDVSYDDALLCAQQKARDMVVSTWRDKNCLEIAQFCNMEQTCSYNCPDGSVKTIVVPAGTICRNSQLEADTDAMSYACQMAQKQCGSISYWNNYVCCSSVCPDGSVFNACVPPGIVEAATQEDADNQAYNIACIRASANRICLGRITPICCLNKSFSSNIIASGGVNPLTFYLIAGSVPTGLSFSVFGSVLTLSGTPTTSGVYFFQIKVVDGILSTMVKTFSLSVIEISPDTLPDAKIGEAYTQSLSAANIPSGVSVSWIQSGGSLPFGLTVDSSGVLSGTPSGSPASYSVTFELSFTYLGTVYRCSKQYNLTVNSGGFGTITPDIMSATPSYWDGGASIPAGNYRIKYINGAMQWTGTGDWRTNANFIDAFFILYNNGAVDLRFNELTDTIFSSQAEVEAANAGKYHDFVHTGGKIGMHIFDTGYYNNKHGTPDPTFELITLP